jgi:4-hydroxythreonine-4-phosphate dehydrogenase
VVQLAQRRALSDITVVADPQLLEARAQELGLPLSPHTGIPRRSWKPGDIHLDPVALATPARAGVLEPRNAAYVVETLRRATAACLEGRARGLITGPVQKSLINAAGIPFTGHTEFLAELCGGPRPVMMLVAGSLRVALATTHVPLSRVPAAISTKLIGEVLSILDRDLRARFQLQRPRIAVCGINPHAGEDGLLGDEESRVLEPALVAARRSGMDVVGPLPADTVFTRPRVKEFAALLAMYHDQGLPVLKYAGFGHAVNITLGLPILRTSVDHGTALDLAGSGRASPESLRAAIALARRLSRRAVQG